VLIKTDNKKLCTTQVGAKLFSFINCCLFNKILIIYIAFFLFIWYIKIKRKNPMEGKIMDKRLYKLDKGKMIDGVCGGIAEYFNIDPSLVRLGWILFSVCGGSGILAYIIAALVIPRKPDDEQL
jgi:phage shock protein C